MTKIVNNCWYYYLLCCFAMLSLGIKTLPAKAQSQSAMYNPIPLLTNQEISDNISDKDIPTGEGGFARDYFVNLEESDQVAIDLTSDDFDAVAILVAADGSTVAENDDGPDGTTNSLLFARINEPGRYIVRVRAFGETGAGKFNLKLTRLQPVNR
ncbi:MAG: PPC domain-containing protein [Xenococcaceae cyanobacterium]